MISDSVNGSRPKLSSRRVTRMATPSESSPDSSNTKSSVSGGRALDPPLIRSISEITAALIDIRKTAMLS